MNCPKCGNDNPIDAKFCSECGTSLRITCQVCGTEALANAKFCSNCGNSLHGEAQPVAPQDDLARYLPEELLAKLRSARSGHAMQGERRTVTMLFADVTGSTAAAEQFDPEDWVEIMNGAFEHLIAPIYRYEGTLAQLRGDAILAFFGAPIAHEDDPVRALRAGLEMLDAMATYSAEVEAEWGIPLQIRVGVNTGLVVVGEVGSDLRVEYTALGDAINVAARMEQTAQPGTVQVTEETLSRTDGVFETVELGPIEVKGKSEPVVSHRVIRYEGAADQSAQTPLVGRDDELSRLDGLLEAMRSNSGWVGSIVAEAGVGKTRLLQEWRSRSMRNPGVATTYDSVGDIFWLEESSRSYDARDPFSTIRNLLRRFWDSSDAPPEYSTIVSALGTAGIEDPDTAALMGYLAGAILSPDAEVFIGALETPALNAKAGEALLTYLGALTDVRPTLVLFEDVHWADDVSLALIEEMMSVAENAPLGVMASMRPYRDEPAWRIHQVAEQDHHHRYHQFELSPLGSEEGSALIDLIAGANTLSDVDKQGILERSDGNPFFIEEIVKSLAEVASESVLPSSLTGTLTARLDRLEEESKYLVQVASVLGTEFDRQILAVILGEEPSFMRLTDLLRKGILVETPDRPGALRFRHALFQEAAYETILRRTRRELHRRVADFLREEHPEKPQEISTHLVEAGATAEAFPYLIEAGLKASRSMSLAEAIRLLSLALDNVPEGAEPDDVQKAHEALGEAYAFVPDLSQASAAYQRLYEYGESHDWPSARVAALNRLGWTTATLGGDLDGAMTYLEDARDLAERTGDDLGLAEYHMNACFVVSLAGDVGAAVQHDEKTVELGKKSGIDVIRISGMVRRAVNYAGLLDFEKAIPAIEQGLEETSAPGMEEAHAVVEAFGVGMVGAIRGELNEAEENLARNDATLERYSSFYRPMNLRQLGWLRAELGDVEGALAAFVEGIRVAQRQHQAFIGAAAASSAAALYADIGFVEPVDALVADAEASFQGPMADFLASTIWADLGFVSLALGEEDRAREHFETGLRVHSTTQYIERPRLLIGLALACVQSCEMSMAEDALSDAQRIISDKGLAVYWAPFGLAKGLFSAAREDLGSAEAALISGQQSAMDLGQRMWAVRILQARGEVAVAGDRIEDAREFRRSADEALRTIAGEIVDPTLQESVMAGISTYVRHD